MPGTSNQRSASPNLDTNSPKFCSQCGTALTKNVESLTGENANANSEHGPVKRPVRIGSSSANQEELPFLVNFVIITVLIAAAVALFHYFFH